MCSFALPRSLRVIEVFWSYNILYILVVDNMEFGDICTLNLRFGMNMAMLCPEVATNEISRCAGEMSSCINRGEPCLLFIDDCYGIRGSELDLFMGKT